MANEKIFYATGRRKTSAARVFLRTGKGNLVINGLKADKYLKRLQSQMVILQPFEVVDQMGKFDVDVTVNGGGENGQTLLLQGFRNQLQALRSVIDSNELHRRRHIKV